MMNVVTGVSAMVGALLGPIAGSFAAVGPLVGGLTGIMCSLAIHLVRLGPLRKRESQIADAELVISDTRKAFADVTSEARAMVSKIGANLEPNISFEVQFVKGGHPASQDPQEQQAADVQKQYSGFTTEQMGAVVADPAAELLTNESGQPVDSRVLDKEYRQLPAVGAKQETPPECKSDQSYRC